MISKKKKKIVKKKVTKNMAKAMDWAMLVALTVADAKRKGGTVFLDIGSVKTGIMLQETLTQLAMRGEDAAWDVQIRVHTLH
jgi:hypothetical protein